MKIKNFSKFVRSILIFLSILIVLSIIISKNVFSYQDIQYKTIYASKGDTLWNIAKNEKNTNTYYKDKHIKSIIYDIMKENNLTDSSLEIGQELSIPEI